MIKEMIEEGERKIVKRAVQAEKRLAYIVKLASFPHEGLTISLGGGGRDTEHAAYICTKAMPAVYAPTIEEAIDKAIQREMLIQDHHEKLRALGVSE